MAQLAIYRFATWPPLAALWLAGTPLLSCVAQEPYEPARASGGAGKASGGSAGLQLSNPGGASAGVGGVAGEQPSTATCHGSGECAKPFPYCSATLGRCVECVSQKNCNGTGRAYCEPRTNACVHCLADTQCTRAAPYCATTIGECVECISSANCGRAGVVCDRDSFHCVPSCKSNAECASAPSTPICDPERNLCVACVSDDSCPANLPRCTADTKACVKCLADDDCASPSSRCDLDQHACVECLTNNDCQSGVQCVAGACANPH